MSSEETPSTRPSALPDVPAAAEGRELQELRKEVIEARNLVIKTDNLLKNMHAEIKKMGMRQEEFARRRLASSATAYICFTVLAVIGSTVLVKSQSTQEKDQIAQAESRAKTLTSQSAELQAREAARREMSEKAARVYEQLGSEKEGPGLNQAMTNALRMDRQMLSALESKALDDRVASLKTQVAQTALDRGQAEYRRGDYKAAAGDLGRYIDLTPAPAETMIFFHLGHARAMNREWPGVIPAMESFLKTANTTKTAQTAGFYLAEAYEEGGNYAKATEAYSRAQALYPGSELAPVIRARMRRLPQLQAAAAGNPAPAAAPAAAPVPAPAAPAKPAPHQ